MGLGLGKVGEEREPLLGLPHSLAPLDPEWTLLAHMHRAQGSSPLGGHHKVKHSGEDSFLIPGLGP